jgi:uncharacterized membrane protein YcaP (DUF421 family)
MDETIHTWFNSFNRLASVAVGAIFFFGYIVLLTRVLGKRSTGQMNNFDWIVTVAVGALAASGILSKDVSIVDAAVAIAILGAAQWLTTWLAIRSAWFRRIVKGNPQLLLHKGEFRTDAMRHERIDRSEILTALRSNGFLHPEEANWVVLENDGTLTVIPRREDDLDDAELMADVNHDV